MVSSIWLLLFFIVPATILDLLVAPTIAQGDGLCTLKAEYCWKCSETAGSYTNGSMYQQNLNSLLSSFSSDTTQNSGFYHSSLGQDSNKVNAIALCRGDLRLEDCRSCVSETTQILLRNCSNHHKEAILWSCPCMVRYSPNLIFGVKEEDPYKYLPSKDNPSNEKTFELVLKPLLENLSNTVALGDSREKFKAGHATVPGAETIYALVQCTPDIDKESCSICLKNCISFILDQGKLMQGARVLKPSCNVRYEVSNFYESTADSLVNVSASVTSATPQTPTPPPPNKGKTIIIIIVVVIAFNMLLGGIYCFSRIQEFKTVQIPRTKRILKQRLKVPPALNQFTKTLDKNLAISLFKMLLKYRPEDKAERERLLKRAQVENEGKIVEAKKPIVVKYGLSHVTYLIEQNKAQHVVSAHDVDPIELVVWLPALGRKMEISYCIVKGKACLGVIVHQKTATILCLTTVKNEDKMEFNKVLEAIKANFNGKYEEYRKKWGGGIMGSKLQAKTTAKERLLAKNPQLHFVRVVEAKKVSACCQLCVGHLIYFIRLEAIDAGAVKVYLAKVFASDGESMKLKKLFSLADNKLNDD